MSWWDINARKYHCDTGYLPQRPSAPGSTTWVTQPTGTLFADTNFRCLKGPNVFADTMAEVRARNAALDKAAAKSKTKK